MEHRPLVCPTCRKNPCDTVVSVPYVRGFVLAAEYGKKNLVGCQKCVKRQLLKEVGISAVAGWFSPSALVANPFCLAYNGLRIPFVKPNPQRVEQVLESTGALELDVNLARVAASLAATMVAADGKIERSEIEVAIRVGGELFEDFTPELFHQVLGQVEELPPSSYLAVLLGERLSEPDRLALAKYLIRVANADGEMDPAEARLVREAVGALGLSLSQLKAEEPE